MADLVKYGLLFAVLYSTAHLSSSESDSATLTSSSLPKSDRGGRKLYEAELYTGPDQEELPYAAESGLPRSLTGTKYVIPYRHAGSGILKKNGNNPNWNVWKANEEESEEDESNEHRPKWQPPSHHQWNNEQNWVADPMSILLLKNAMAEINDYKKKEGFLEKITSEPALLLIAASIPISLLLMAVMPSIMGYVFRESYSTVTTTATGSRNNEGDIMPYLAPVIEAIGTFGVRSISNPDCMQRIFCQVAQEKVGFPDSKYLKKAASVARYLSNGSWLENLGVKEIVDSLSSGDCESISCGPHPEKETVESRYSKKDHSNTVQ